MKKILLGAVGTLAMITSASAADLAARPYTKAPVAAALVTNWTGFYIGAEGGYGWGKDDWRLPTNNNILGSSTNLGGGVAGGVIGYNWQAPSNIVIGVEGNLGWADISGSSVCITNLALNCRSQLDSMFTATARLGYAFNSALIYVKGGGAWTTNNYSVTTVAGGVLAESGSANREGWTVGAGLEYMFAPNWSAKVEYDYYDFGSKTTTLVFPAGGAADIIKSSLTVNTVKAGINYHFNWAGPVAAKY